jgi:hypothetical protein
MAQGPSQLNRIMLSRTPGQAAMIPDSSRDVPGDARSYRQRALNSYEVMSRFPRASVVASAIGELLTVGDNFTPFVGTFAYSWRRAHG